MNLKKYDGKCVQIIDRNGTIYEGISYYNCRDYCFHEYNRDEECLDIMNILFYKNDIKKIMSLERHHGPYGKFSEPFGEIEKMIVDDGIDFIEEAFESEENEHIYRIILCLETKSLNNEIIKLLNNLIKYNNDERIINKAKELIERNSNEDN